jgi:outer membrane receptor protein involved in Fe transport
MVSSQAIVWYNTSRVISNVFNATSPTADANGSVNARMFRLPNTTYRTKQVIDSALFAFQSFLANERIVFTGGLRWDTQDLYNALGWAHPETGEWSSADEMILPDDPYATNGASTGSLGLTWHVSRLFSLSWNKSENFNPPGAVFTVFDTPLPLSRGKTQDIGFKFRLLDEKITGSLNYFQAERLNERYRSGSNPYRVMALWNVVDPSMAPTLDTTAWSDTRDLRTQGYEFQVTANPSPAWRISANITQLKTEQGNLKPLTQAYFNEHEQTWLSVPQDTPCPVQGDSRNLTVADVLYYLKQDIRAHIALNGQPAYNLSEWAVNLVGNYTVQTGPLKNFNAGLAQQWRNGPLIGFVYYVDANTGLNLPDLSRKIYGTDWWNTNIWFGYERRIMKSKVRMILKLSINNLFDQRTYDMESFINSHNEVEVSRYRFLAPRNFMLTATFQY